MKMGIRKPSIKRSVKARTTGKLKRNVKKAVNPLYSKNGMGYINDPKKAIYNKVYNKTTIGVSDIINSGSNFKSDLDGVPDELLEKIAAYEEMENNTSPRTWKICGFLMKSLAVICAVIFGLPGLFAGMFPLLIIAVIAAVAMWKLGSSWTKKATASKETENVQMQEEYIPMGNVHISVYNSERCLAHKCDPAPVDLGEYASNAGGFTNWATYDVTALNPTTNRKNKRRYRAVNQKHIEKLATAEGLVNVEIVNVIPHEAPTEKQLNYAKDLGLSIPEGACKEDVSAILSRLLDSTDSVREEKVSATLVRNYYRPLESPTKEFAVFASEMGICFSAYIGEKALLEKVIYNLDIRDKLAFYAYCALCSRNYEKIGNMLKSSQCDQFYQFSDNSLEAEAIIRSLDGRKIEDYLSPHKGTLVYKEAAKYI